HLVDYPTPSNLSYWWGFGPLAGTMILSVLSSPALVSGLMVARAKNLASYYKAPGNKMPTPSFFDFSLSAFAGSYQIDPDYHDQRRGDSYFSSAPGVQETHRHASGSSTNLHLNLNDQSQDPIFLEVERLSLKCDKVKKKTILKTQSLLLERGYHIPDERDIERAINVVMTEHETIDIDRRRKRFYYLYSCLGKTGNKFWMELLETLADYNINIKAIPTTNLPFQIPLVGKALDCALLKVPIAGARILAFAAEVLGLKSYDVLTDLFPPRLE
ncbi:unnamed protein product, partial [Arabidopsis thaliana]